MLVLCGYGNCIILSSQIPFLFYYFYLQKVTSPRLFSSLSLLKSNRICTVGPGGSPDENGETTLDALVMDGVTMNHLYIMSCFIALNFIEGYGSSFLEGYC